MVKEIRTLIRKKTVLFTLFVLNVAFIINCTETPLDPISPGWVKIGTFLLSRYGGLNSIFVDDGAVWGAGYEDNSPKTSFIAVIIRYRGGVFELEYASPIEYEYAELACIAFNEQYNRSGWAVGVKEENSNWGPLILRREQGTGVWTEVNINGNLNSAVISTVLPINEDKCWLLLDDHYYSGEHDGVLAKYSGGELTAYDALGPVTAVYPYTRYIPRTLLYALTYAEDGYAAGEVPKMYVSADEGASWYVEPVPRDYGLGRKVMRSWVRGNFGPTVYVVAEFDNGAWGVIKRTGAPGAGEYELVFLAYPGPYFTDLNGVAFRDAPSDPYGISVDGVAVGKDTTVVFDEGNVYFEKLPYASELSCVIPNLGTGYFAVGKSEPFGSYDLLYHP